MKSILKWSAPLLCSTILSIAANFSGIASVQAQQWQLVWADEFNGTFLDTSKWNAEIGTGAQYGLTGWGNNELQYYTGRPENVILDSGFLHIVALQENFGGMNHTSARLTTRTKGFWTYGRFEARLKMPTGQGTWPAFWMLPEGGNTQTQVSAFWPGEIDIMETIGHSSDRTFGTAHYGVWPNVISSGDNYKLPCSDFGTDFHLYAVEWYPDNIRWYIDDILVHSLDRSETQGEDWLFGVDYFLLINLALGGGWAGNPDVTTTWPQIVIADYIRVYELQPETYDVTFRVDLTQQNTSGVNTVNLNGSFNNWCGGCTPMTSVGNDIYEVTLQFSPGIHEYKFTTNGWSGLIEQFAPGTSCAITSVFLPDTFVNRFVNVGFEDVVLDAVCFNNCLHCISNSNSGCTDPTATNYNSNATVNSGVCTYPVTFEVDMNCASNSFSQVYLSGPWNGWCGNCNPLSDPDQDGVWTGTFNFQKGPLEYKFQVDNWASQEDLVDEANAGETCVRVTDCANYWNRISDIHGIQLISATYGQCQDCSQGCSVPDSLQTTNVLPDAATLNWTPNPEALRYEIRGRNLNNSNYVTLLQPWGGATTKNVFGLLTGQTYEWMVRAWCDSSGTLISDWSEPDTFATGCHAPINLGTAQVSPSGVVLQWQNQPSVSGYQLRGRKIGNPGWLLIDIPNVSSKTVFGLNPATSYEWQIRTICDLGSGVVSTFSSLDTFTTFGNGRLFKPMEEFKVFPNLLSSYGTLHFNQHLENVSVEIVDQFGHRILHRKYSTIHKLDVHGLQTRPGLHFIKIGDGQRFWSCQFVIAE